VNDWNIPPESVTPGQLFMLLQAINAKQSMIVSDQQRIAQRIEKLESDTSDMVQAWKAGGTVLRIIKWAAAVGAAFVAIAAFVRGLIP
jgi:hypothetical protein